MGGMLKVFSIPALAGFCFYELEDEAVLGLQAGV